MVDYYNPNHSLKNLAGHTEKKETSVNSNDFLYKNIKPLQDVERNAIQHAIDLCDGNIPKAAVFLDVAPSTIYRKIKHWEKTLAKDALDD